MNVDNTRLTAPGYTFYRPCRKHVGKPGTRGGTLVGRVIGWLSQERQTCKVGCSSSDSNVAPAHGVATFVLRAGVL